MYIVVDQPNLTPITEEEPRYTAGVHPLQEKMGLNQTIEAFGRDKCLLLAGGLIKKVAMKLAFRQTLIAPESTSIPASQTLCPVHNTTRL